MPNDQFYAIEGKKNERELTIVNCAMLVGKAPNKEKRIRIKIRMFLTGKSNAGAPEWLDNAYTYVGKNHETVSLSEVFRGYQLHFNVENLFGKKGAKAPKSILRAFVVSEFGDREENPDVICTFTIVAPFSKALWNWLGQYGGEDVWCKFIPGDDEPGEAEDGEEEDEDEEEDDKPAKPAKSGPKQLLEFHETQTGKKK